MYHVCRPGRAFLHCMIETSMKAWHLHHRIKLNQEFHRDVDWWLHYLPNGMGSAFCMSPTVSPVQNVNFSLMPVMWAFGCYFQGHWCQGKFPVACFWDGPISINWRELYAITMALAIWEDQFKAK